MKVKDVMEAMSHFKPDENIVVCWWDKPLGMSAHRWESVCRLFNNEDPKNLQTAIHWWIEDQRDEIPALIPHNKTEGENTSEPTG